ncbi:MAG: hypothetical protein JNK37_18995 [Verrucomicrobiales bacterium]|nr:hypothetical protein [Verrucomicrobiales bacterium]
MGDSFEGGGNRLVEFIGRSGFRATQAELHLASLKRELSIPEIIRCRVRCFCDGAVFGSVEFVNGVFEANRWRYGLKQKSGARRLRGGADRGELRKLRDLQVRPVG